MVAVLSFVVVGLAFAVVALAFLLLGLMRKVEVLDWHYQQLQSTTPRRLGRDGLSPGKMAPDFKLSTLAGTEQSLQDYAGRKVLLVFIQQGCGPCHDLLPELARLKGEPFQVLVVNSGAKDSADAVVRKHATDFPVLFQDGLEVSKRYQILSTPFAFMINESGRVAAKGVVNTAQHVQLLLDEARQWESRSKSEPTGDDAPEAESSTEEQGAREPVAAANPA